MFEDRLTNLRKAGYGSIKLEAIVRSLTEDAINRIGDAKTPAEAVQVLREEFANAKAVVDEVNTEEE